MQHVVEEGNSRVAAATTSAVEVEGDLHVGFPGGAAHGCGSGKWKVVGGGGAIGGLHEICGVEHWPVGCT